MYVSSGTRTRQKKTTRQTVKSMETHLLKDCLMRLLSFSPGGFSSLSTEECNFKHITTTCVGESNKTQTLATFTRPTKI